MSKGFISELLAALDAESSASMRKFYQALSGITLRVDIDGKREKIVIAKETSTAGRNSGAADIEIRLKTQTLRELTHGDKSFAQLLLDESIHLDGYTEHISRLLMAFDHLIDAAVRSKKAQKIFNQNPNTEQNHD